MGGGTTLVTTGKHFSHKVPVSSCTGTGRQCLEKEGAGGAAARILRAHRRATPLSSREGAEGKRVSGDGAAMLLRGRAASVLQASLTSYRPYHLPTRLLVDQSFVPHGL